MLGFYGDRSKSILPHVWGEVYLAGVACNHVTFENLLFVQSEAILGSKDEDLVVHGLTGQPFTYN